MTVVFGKWEEREDMNLNVFVGNIKKFQLRYKAVGDFVVNYFQKLYIYISKRENIQEMLQKLLHYRYFF